MRRCTNPSFVLSQMLCVVVVVVIVSKREGARSEAGPGTWLG